MKTLSRFSATLLLMMALAFACDPKTETPPEVSVKAEFEMNPPQPSNIFIQELEKPIGSNNVLFGAEFPGGEIKSQFLSVMAGDTAVVLRDDGKGGDEKPNDRVFSILLQEDLNQLRETGQSEMKTMLSKKSGFEFVNRSADMQSLAKIQKMSERFRELKFSFKERIPVDLFVRNPTVQEIVSIRDHSLMITNTGVVEDPQRTFNPCTRSGNPNGAWTFGQLMAELANEAVTGVNPVDFTKAWLQSWSTSSTVNGDVVAARRNIQRILDSWQFRSGAGPLKMEALPFKLLAIVNRLDLRGNSGYGFSNAGEGRLVFAALDRNCSPLQFTVIFEYGINKRSCSAVKSFAQQWIDLQSDPIGSPTYNSKLQAITDQFTRAGTNTSKPNGSSLNQLRTNEIALAAPWELREFVLDPNSHLLTPTTVKQEPATIYNRVNIVSPPQPVTLTNIAKLAKFVNDNQAAIENNVYTVPDSFDGSPFLAGKAITPDATSFHWNGGTAPPQMINSSKARHIFSLNTCSGCHGGETRTFAFTHIRPAPFGSTASLSPFLTGLGTDDNASDNDTDPLGLFFVNDPAGNLADSPRGFNDLSRRAVDLFTLAGTSCRFTPINLATRLRFVPVRMTH